MPPDSGLRTQSGARGAADGTFRLGETPPLTLANVTLSPIGDEQHR